MKKLFACLLTLSLLLCACSAAPESDPKLLEYPGIPWGSSPEQVMEVLNIREADLFQVAEDSESDALDYDTYAFQILGLEMFGHTSVSAIFQFRDYTRSGNYGLGEIIIYYPDGYHAEAVDRTAVQAELEKLYGPALEQYNTYTWTGTDLNRTGHWPTYPLWHSETTLFDLMTPEELELYKAARLKVLESRDAEVLPGEEELQLLEDTNVSRITFPEQTNRTAELSDQEREENLWTDNELTLNGRMVIMVDYLLSISEEYLATQADPDHP